MSTLQLLDDKQLVAVALVNPPHDVDLTAGAWYWSPASKTRHDTGIVDMFELSLTRRPASMSLRAVRALPGDLHFGSDRDRWDLPASTRRMLEDAADADRGQPLLVRTGSPIARPVVTRGYDAGTADRILARITEPDAGRSHRRATPGRPDGIGYSRPMRGSVISVR